MPITQPQRASREHAQASRSPTRPVNVSSMLDPPRVPSSVCVLTVVAATGGCAIFVGGLVSWPLLVAGGLVLIAALAALWMIQRRRDRTLW
jgi:membrane protein YdbS with pleckstrin-like domain